MLLKNIPTPDESFSREQISRAKEVIILHNSLDHPSNNTLINALNNGLILGTRLTGKDVDICEKIFGKCKNCIAGKITRPSYKNSCSVVASSIGSILHVDFHIFSEPTIGSYSFCIICVDEFSSYMSIVMIKSKAMCFLTDAFDELISFYLLYNYTIKKIECDSESCLGAYVYTTFKYTTNTPRTSTTVSTRSTY